MLINNRDHVAGCRRCTVAASPKCDLSNITYGCERGTVFCAVQRKILRASEFVLWLLRAGSVEVTEVVIKTCEKEALGKSHEEDLSVELIAAFLSEPQLQTSG